MKHLNILFFLFFFAANAFAQSNGGTSVTSTSTASNNVINSKLPPIDASPMDMSYFPANYPVLKIQEKAEAMPVARVIYSRPQRNNRVIFGDLIEYGKVWRLGANEATEVEFFRDVKINGKKLLKGRYTIYALVNPDQWTVIFNRDTDTWGSFKYDEKKDVLRMNVPVQKVAAPVDAFTVFFDKTNTGADLIVTWDTIKVSIPVSLK
jgi:hypothetical protein